MANTPDRFNYAPYQFFVLAISVIAIGLLGISATNDESLNTIMN